MPTEARAEILNRIRKATGPSPSPEVVAAEWTTIPRAYNRHSARSLTELVERLTDRLHDYDAQVLEVEAEAVPAAVARMLRARGLTRLVVPAGIREGLLPEGSEFEFFIDTGLSTLELDQFSGVLTEATLAIAETGTLVLQNVPGQGRRAATLIPDYHLCIVDATNIVDTVPEAIARLQPTASLASTFISGPSATADIEMTRIKGVHGPRFLDVILFR